MPRSGELIETRRPWRARLPTPRSMCGEAKARTLEFRHRVTLSGDTLRYEETTVLEIYGKRFDHTDANELERA